MAHSGSRTGPSHSAGHDAGAAPFQTLLTGLSIVPQTQRKYPLARAEGESEELSPRQLAKMSPGGPIIPVVENMFRGRRRAHHPVAPETYLELLATTAA